MISKRNMKCVGGVHSRWDKSLLPRYQHNSKEPREMRAALAKHPAPVMIGHPKDLMADASPTPTPPPWGDHRCRVQKDGMQGENESEGLKDELLQEVKN